MNRLILKPGEEKRILAGHPWVYENEVASILGATGPASLAPGEIVDVESSRKHYLGRALANPNSKILGRIFSPSKEGMDKGFFKRRFKEAILRRTRNYDLSVESARLVFAEADFLPGLIVDRFVGWPLAGGDPSGKPESWLCLQFLSYGMDQRRDEILAAITEVLESTEPLVGLGRPRGIIERDEAPVRELEGLEIKSGILAGDYPEGGIRILENGHPFAVDLIGGQKTGHFLDQRDNHALTARLARGRRVMDACCHTGGFAIQAAAAGATSVVAIDSSASALEVLKKNAELNGVADRVIAVEANVFDLLREYERKKEAFDLIVLDPPAFAKSRTALEGAIRGYKEINLRALNLLGKGGILVTCSCSHAMDENRFKAMVASAAEDAGKRLRLLDFRYQASDHPILIGYEESLYLKCGFYEVL